MALSWRWRGIQQAQSWPQPAQTAGCDCSMLFCQARGMPACLCVAVGAALHVATARFSACLPSFAALLHRASSACLFPCFPVPSPLVAASLHNATTFPPCLLLLCSGSVDHVFITLCRPGSGVDGPSSLAALESSRFGECLLELALPCSSWGLAAAFAPDGRTLAVASQGPQGAHLTLLAGIDLSAPSSLDAAVLEAQAKAAGSGATPRLQHLPLDSLPLKCLAFLSDSVLAGGGFDCQPQLFARRADGRWQLARSLAGEGGRGHTGRS